MDSEARARRILGFAGLAFAAAVWLGAGCPKPIPPSPIGPPDASDAARPATCAAGCAHAVAVCNSVDDSVCLDACNRNGTPFAERIAAATDCPGVKAADPGAPAAQSGPTHPNGR
jgi:hypothetical protein